MLKLYQINLPQASQKYSIVNDLVVMHYDLVHVPLSCLALVFWDPIAAGQKTFAGP